MPSERTATPPAELLSNPDRRVRFYLIHVFELRRQAAEIRRTSRARRVAGSP